MGCGAEPRVGGWQAFGGRFIVERGRIEASDALGVFHGSEGGQEGGDGGIGSTG